MLPDLTLIQWAVLAGALALVIVPRLGALRTPLGFLAGIVRRPVPDVHAKVDAYYTLAEDLPPELAKRVWACIQSPATPEVPHAA